MRTILVGSWKARRRFLQTRSEKFPCEVRLQSGVSTRMEYSVYANGAERCPLHFWVGNPLEIPRNTCRASSADSPAVTGVHNTCFQQVQEDIHKSRSVCKKWYFVSRDTELSVGKFLTKYFTPLTTSEEQHIGIVSDEDAVDVWAVAKEETK